MNLLPPSTSLFWQSRSNAGLYRFRLPLPAVSTPCSVSRPCSWKLGHEEHYALCTVILSGEGGFSLCTRAGSGCVYLFLFCCIRLVPILDTPQALRDLLVWVETKGFLDQNTWEYSWCWRGPLKCSRGSWYVSDKVPVIRNRFQWWRGEGRTSSRWAEKKERTSSGGGEKEEM